MQLASTHVQQDDREPLLLIPLTIASAFLLVSKSAISAYTGILTGTVQRKFVVTISDGPSDDENRLSESWFPYYTLRGLPANVSSTCVYFVGEASAHLTPLRDAR